MYNPVLVQVPEGGGIAEVLIRFDVMLAFDVS